MMNKRWNDDVAYVFSTHRLFLKVYGLWPLQKQTVFTKIQWGFCLITQFMILPCLTTELLWSSKDASSNIESITFFASTSTGLIKNICLIVSQKKLGMNINAAIDDWLSVKNNVETRKIMKKYAVQSKILTFTLLYSLYVCLGMYMAVVIFINLKQIFSTDMNLVNVNTTDWLLLIPSGSLGQLITGPQYAIILTIQIVQTSLLSFLLFTVDSFFFNVTIHLTGQLEVLKNNFKTFTKEPNTEANYRKKFVNFVNRHNLLMELYQNLEDIFHFLILYEIVIVTVLLALIGLRLNICINEKDHVEAIKSVFVLNYLIMQSLVYTYGGEFLQKESEDIFYMLYTTSWFTLPAALMKDVHFAMMRSSIPFRLTGGKFFYINRETMMYILKTAASYISVLRIALRK
ncbi:Odorant receptor 47a [Acromyrmex echinatior]|uniref:Odorant receptor n=1 Tax=Acromyrmex echinatior TaxID=103372 RepID=F4X4D6_ACREC|nr:Odorant receptor 47a [Acromyrmex echinatior]